MFARDFVHVHQPFEQVAPRFAREPTWLEPIVTDALGQAPTQQLEFDLPSPSPRFAERAHCTRGPLRVRDSTLVVPLIWFFERDPLGLSPVESDLTVTPVDPTQCLLILEARLRPPASVRPSALQHVVEAVLRSFLHGLADIIDPERASPST